MQTVTKARQCHYGQQVSVELYLNKSQPADRRWTLRCRIEQCLRVEQMEEAKKTTQEEFDRISTRAQDEVRPQASC